MSSNNSSLEKKLSEEGYKLTQNRRLILEVLQQFSEKWITAQDIFEKVNARNSKINFSTVYRNLDILSKIGLLCQVDKGQGLSVYSLNYQEHHHHHLVCKSCGKIRKVEFCPLKELGLEQFHDFIVEEHKFEVYGYCVECKKCSNA